MKYYFVKKIGTKKECLSFKSLLPNTSKNPAYFIVCIPTQPDKAMNTAVIRIPLPFCATITAATHLISEQDNRSNTIGRFRFVCLHWFPNPYQKLECRDFDAKTTAKLYLLMRHTKICVVNGVKHDVVIHGAFFN